MTTSEAGACCARAAAQSAHDDPQTPSKVPACPAFKLANDPRVTTVGRYLRKSCIDEMPQLVNVLKGEMSLVGPRPHAIKAKAAGKLYDDVVDGYAVRHKVKPGITGWAQVRHGYGSSVEESEAKLRYDLYYIKHMNPWLDLVILLDIIFPTVD